MKEHSSQFNPFFVSSIVSLVGAIAIVVLDDVILAFIFIPPVLLNVTWRLFLGWSSINWLLYYRDTIISGEPHPSKPVALLIYLLLLYLFAGLSTTFEVASILFAMGFLSIGFLSLFTSR